jgi:hypothetical protein
LEHGLIFHFRLSRAMIMAAARSAAFLAMTPFV